MALYEQKITEYSKRIYLSRMRILLNNGFYGLLLMHIIPSIDEECKSVATDGNKIYFAPQFLDNISDDELDYVMIHQILHIALKHCFREGGKKSSLFDEACDIVVNSNILLSNNMNEKSITLKNYGVSKHTTPDNEEGYKYTVEEVYSMLLADAFQSDSDDKSTDKSSGKCKKDYSTKNKSGVDNHERWNNNDMQKDYSTKNKSGWDNHERWNNNDMQKDVWVKRVIDSARTMQIREAAEKRGTLPLFAKRMLQELKNPQTDWRTILTDFIQEEICDYSFSPPDKRFDDSPFFLPDFNEKEYKVYDILFMIDTSGSMSDKMLTAAYSEVKGAIEQFDGKLKGWLGFFDAEVIKPREFDSIEELQIIRPQGGGGTDFEVIFDYVNTKMANNPPASIIILTDGYAPFPDITKSNDIPVLWLLNNERVKPPWGKVARIKI